jgi:hypothetical protein
MSTTETNRKNLLALIEGITTGRLMECFERYYADDVVMCENGVADANRIGKAANRGYEQYFVDNAQWFGVKVGPVIVDGDHSSYLMWMDFSFQGHRMVREQLALQEWKNGQIVKETFYYDPAAKL